MRDRIDPKLLLSGKIKRIYVESGAESRLDGAYAYRGERQLQILVGMGEEGYAWEHVSVSIVGFLAEETPTWAEMCEVKDIFWREDEAVVQFHPPKSENKSLAEVLHLWRPWGDNIPMPPSVMV